MHGWLPAARWLCHASSVFGKAIPCWRRRLPRFAATKKHTSQPWGHFGIGPDPAFEGLPEEAAFDEWFQTLTFSHTSECAERWLEAGAILVSSPLPDHVVNALRSLRELYSLGHSEATLAFCRTVAEAAAHHWLLEKGHISRARPDWARDADRLRERRPDLKFLLADIAVVRLKANEILHAKRRSRSMTEAEAYAGMRTTFRFVECLHQTE